MLDRMLPLLLIETRSLADPCSGQYDQEYLDYLKELLTIMHEEGVAAYVVRQIF
jgi:hypothetical protein